MLERAHAQGELRADFGFADLAVLLWSFAPLTEAIVRRRAERLGASPARLLDGLRTGAATPQNEPPLSDEDMRVLRERRMGRRA